MTDIEAFKCISQLNDCMVIRYEIFVTDLIFTLDLVDDQLGIAISFKVLYPHLLGELEANEQITVISYIVGTRFRQRKCMRKDIFSGEINITPSPVTILPFGPVLDVSSKNIYNTSSLEIMLASMTSSRISSCSFEDSGTG